MSYSYQRVVTIDHTKVPVNKSHFTVLFSGTYSFLKHVSNGGLVENINGYDIGFLDEVDGGTLSWEVEQYNPATGNIIAWVQLDVSSTIDSTFVLAYGNSSITTPQFNTGDPWWDEYGVWHLSDGVTVDGGDSTYDAFDSSVVGTVNAVSGTIDGAAEFPSSADGYLDAGDIWLDYTFEEAATLFFWIKSSSSPTTGRIISKTDGSSVGFEVKQEGTDLSFVIHRATSPSIWKATGAIPADNSWHHIAITYSGNLSDGAPAVKIYVDASSQSVTYTAGSGAGDYSSGYNFYIGGSSLLAGASGRLNACLDEVRYVYGSLSASVVQLHYNTQNSPITFYSVGDEIPFTVTGQTTDGYEQVSYSVPFSSVAGQAPLTWSIASGSLPPGLIIDSSYGSVSGTPTLAGTYTFTVRATDSASRVADLPATIVIAPEPPPFIYFSATYSKILKGQTTTLSWGAYGPPVDSVTLDGTPVDTSGSLDVSPEVTTTYTIVATNEAGSRTATVTVTVDPAPFIISGPVPITPEGIYVKASQGPFISPTNPDTVGVICIVTEDLDDADPPHWYLSAFVSTDKGNTWVEYRGPQIFVMTFKHRNHEPPFDVTIDSPGHVGEVYDVGTDVWSNITDLPKGMYLSCGQWLNDIMMFNLPFNGLGEVYYPGHYDLSDPPQLVGVGYGIPHALLNINLYKFNLQQLEWTDCGTKDTTIFDPVSGTFPHSPIGGTYSGMCISNDTIIILGMSRGRGIALASFSEVGNGGWITPDFHGFSKVYDFGVDGSCTVLEDACDTDGKLKFQSHVSSDWRGYMGLFYGVVFGVDPVTGCIGAVAHQTKWGDPNEVNFDERYRLAYWAPNSGPVPTFVDIDTGFDSSILTPINSISKVHPGDRPTFLQISTRSMSANRVPPIEVGEQGSTQYTSGFLVNGNVWYDIFSIHQASPDLQLLKSYSTGLYTTFEDSHLRMFRLVEQPSPPSDPAKRTAWRVIGVLPGSFNERSAVRSGGGAVLFRDKTAAIITATSIGWQVGDSHVLFRTPLYFWTAYLPWASRGGNYLSSGSLISSGNYVV